MDGGFKRGAALLGGVLDHPLHLLVGDQDALGAHHPGGARGTIKHVALAQEPFRPVFVQNHPGIQRRRHLERDPARHVGFDDPGDDIRPGGLRGDDHVQPRRARFLGDPRDGAFHVRRRRLHEVRQLVHDDDDVGHPIRDNQLVGVPGNLDFGLGFGDLEEVLVGHVAEIDFLGGRLGRRLRGLRFPGGRVEGERFLIELLLGLWQGPGVEAADVAHVAFGEDGVPLFHLIHRPAQGEQHLLRVGHHGHNQVGEGVVHLHFDHLGVDHDQAQILRGEPVENAGDDGVDAHAFAGPSGAGHQAVGHGGQVGDHGFAVNIFAECDGDFGFGLEKIVAFEQLAQGDLLFL